MKSKAKRSVARQFRRGFRSLEIEDLEDPAVREPSSGDDPETLLQRAKAGDREAVGRLLATYRNYLMLLAGFSSISA